MIPISQSKLKQKNMNHPRNNDILINNVSIICVYNRPDIFQNTLVKSLSNQDHPFEIIGLDNTSSRFPSAAKALNSGANEANGDLFVFVHQDVSFEKADSLRRLISIFMNNTVNGDVGGIVGKGYNENSQSTIVAGSRADFNGEKVGKNGFMEDYATAESVDEFLLIMTRETFFQHPFNEKACNGWHLYAVEQCMNAHLKKHNVYVINSDVKHYSPGCIDFKYYWAQFRLATYYPFYGRVMSTCCDFYTGNLIKLFLKAIIKSLNNLDWLKNN